MRRALATGDVNADRIAAGARAEFERRYATDDDPEHLNPAWLDTHKRRLRGDLLDAEQDVERTAGIELDRARWFADKAIAHLERIPAGQLSLTYAELGTAIEHVARLVNIYQGLLNGSMWVFEGPALGDWKERSGCRCSPLT